MSYTYPFGEQVKRLEQEDKTPKKVFVLGVYSSAVHARWMKDGKTKCAALAVASEPRIFWDGNPEETKAIISRIKIPAELGKLVPAGRNLNGPSAKVLDKDILEPLGFTRKDAWLCDLLPETRINPNQRQVIEGTYNDYIKQYNLPPVTIPDCPKEYCNEQRAAEIVEEIIQSEAETLVLLGDQPISQFLRKVTDIPYSSLREYTELYGYGTKTEVFIKGETIKVLPLAHPRQIGGLGMHCKYWQEVHEKWDKEVRMKSSV